MSVEMFEQLMLAAQQAGEGAFWLVVMYFASGILGQIITVGAVLTGVFIVAKTIKQLIQQEQDRSEAGVTLMQAYEELTGKATYGGISLYEAREMIREIRSLKEQKQ